MTASTIETPIGVLVSVVDDDGGLVRLDFAQPGELATGNRAPVTWHDLAVEWQATAGCEAASQIAEYFEGSRRNFDLPLACRSGTPFFRQVWDELVAIPFGTTISYRDLAGRVGSTRAFRAVGSANAANPISLVVPCHRVIASNGRLAGYSSGTHLKSALLAHERAVLDGRPSTSRATHE